MNIGVTLENADRHGRFFAVVETVDGKQIWRGPVSMKAAGTAYAVVPVHKLSQGDYILTIKRMSPAGLYEPVGDYSFRIRAPQ